MNSVESYLKQIQDKAAAPAEAIALCEQAIKDYPGHGLFYVHAGEAYAAMGEVESSIRAFEKAAELEPANTLVRGKLAGLLVRAGRIDDAITQHSAILEFSKPVPHWCYVGLGNLLERKGETQKAIANFRLALESKPDATDLQTRLISMYKKLGKESESADLYESLAARESDARKRHDLWCNAARFWAETKEYDKSHAACQKAYEIDPTQISLVTRLIETSIARGAESEVLAIVDKALALDLDPADRRRLQYEREQTITRQRIKSLVEAPKISASNAGPVPGQPYVDLCVSLAGCNVLLIIGWMCGPSLQCESVRLVLGDDDIALTNDQILWFQRSDVGDYLARAGLVKDLGRGFALFKAMGERKLPASAFRLEFLFSDGKMSSVDAIAAAFDEEAKIKLRHLGAMAGKALPRMLFKDCGYLVVELIDLALVAQSPELRFGIEFAVPLPGSRVFLSGWVIDLHRKMESLLLVDEVTGCQQSMLEGACRTPRPDLVDGKNLAKGYAGELGFVRLSAPLAGEKKGIAEAPQLALYAVLEDMSVLRLAVDATVFTDVASAIHHLLHLIPPGITPFLDRLLPQLGPAVDHLWSSRKRATTDPDIRNFGEPPLHPEVSVIVPLFGRCDFLRYQLALFADDPDFEHAELIYVIDDPRIYADAIALSQGIQPIFGVSFKTVYGGRNFGYAGANNLGVSQAGGEYLVLLNSDVMPKYPGWIRQMKAAYEQLNNPGAVGPKLLFEDESLQHTGIHFVRHAPWANLWINEHASKGQPDWPPASGKKDPVPVPAVTGACLFIRKEHYQAAEGLDEGYIRGDFEDSDLCLKMMAQGFTNYYLPAVELYHLERQSQALAAEQYVGRNITLYNCWRYNQKWAHAIESLAEGKWP